MMFEAEFQQQECLRCFYAGFIPLKFAYSGTAARTHDLLGMSGEYQSVVASPTFESETLDGFFKELPHAKPLRWVEIGPGNGIHSIKFWKNFAPAHKVDDLILFDFSDKLVRLASKRLTSALSSWSVRVRRSVWDIERGVTNEVIDFLGDHPGAVVLFGNTLGNVECPPEAMLNIRSSLPDETPLCITCSGFDEEITDEDIVRPYGTAVFAAAALEPLRMLGIKVEAGRMVTTFDRLRRVVECHYTFDLSELEEWSPIDRSKVRIRRIRNFLSRRFTEADVRTLADQGGFLVNRLWWNAEDRVYLAVLS